MKCIFFVVNKKVDKLSRTKTILPGSKYSSSELATSTSQMSGC